MSQAGDAHIQFPSAAELLRVDASSHSHPHAAINAATAASSSSSSSKAKPAAKAKDASPASAARNKSKSSKVQADGTVKPKQSKSRNGCVTCKQKRLKCDETKPTCQQCSKRGVTCGGYKKDFKWRPFEEMSLGIRGPLPIKGKKLDGASVSSVDRLSPQRSSPSDSPETSASTIYQRSTSPSSNQDTPPISKGSPLRSVPQSAVDKSNGGGQNTIMSETSFHDVEDIELHHPLVLARGVPFSETHLEDGQGDFANHVCSETVHSSSADPPLPGDYYRESEQDDFDDVEEVIPAFQDRWEIVNNFATPYDSSNFSVNLSIPTLNQIKLNADSAELLLSNFSKDTVGVLSIRDGPHENPWRNLILPLIHESEAVYHGLAAVTAFHAANIQPSMKRVGVEHIQRSAQLLARDIQHMRPDIALTLTLVLAFAESWDVHVTTGIKHLQGAKYFLQKALPLAEQLGPNHPFTQRIIFLRNTWVYADVIARLNSLDADDSTDFDMAYAYADAALNAPDASGISRLEIDPLMGCAASLFPLIGRVANLVRRVRQSSSNDPDIAVEAAGLQHALFQWSPPLMLVEPEDATLSAPDAVRTAEAYRWATLLYLHQAVPEIPSPTADELARNTLVHVALVPSSSHMTIVQIYPLLAAGSEVRHPADREWVVARWLAMKRRMLIGNIDRCLEVVREVWTRRDDTIGMRWVGSQQQQQQQPLRPQQHAMSPNAFAAHTKASPCWNLADLERVNTSGEDPALASWADSLTSAASMGNAEYSSPPYGRAIHHVPTEEQLPFARTVRGNLHWIGVMQEWNWEVLLG